jgi:hypothetical protein
VAWSINLGFDQAQLIEGHQRARTIAVQRSCSASRGYAHHSFSSCWRQLLLTDPQTSLTSLTHRAALVPTLADRSAASLGVGALSDEENQYIPSKESALRTVIRRRMTSLRIL